MPTLPEIPHSLYFALSAILFTIGAIGVITRRNAIIVFMCLELMLNGVNLAFIAAGNVLHSLDGVVFVFFIMTVAAAEAAVGLAIFVLIFTAEGSRSTWTRSICLKRVEGPRPRSSMADYIWLIPVFPAVGFLINAFLGKKLPKAVVSWVACLALFASFVVSVAILFQFLQLPPEERIFERNIFNWITSGEFNATVGFRIDPLSIIMCLVVTGVGFLIHVYSVGYMHDDEGYARYFTYLNLFVFMMLILVTANNILLMFVGWEGVGLCSYLLIGFWFHKDSAANAGKKAFIVNRIGDFGFLLGMFLLFVSLGAHGVWTLNYGELQRTPTC